jgi:hypothetical protein
VKDLPLAALITDRRASDRAQMGRDRRKNQEPKPPCDEIGRDNLGRPWPRRRHLDVIRASFERKVAGRDDVPLSVADLMRAAYALGHGDPERWLLRGH